MKKKKKRKRKTKKEKKPKLKAYRHNKRVLSYKLFFWLKPEHIILSWDIHGKKASLKIFHELVL